MLVSRNKRMGKTGIAPVWWAPMMLWREVSDQTSAISDTTSAHRVAKEPGIRSRTTFGRAVYAIGNRERAAYLSGIDPQRVVLIAFALSGALSAFAGVLLAGYASKAAQAMGDPYLLPAIAAVVLGGASILGGRGNYLGTVAGVILVTLLQSILSVMQIPEAGRQIAYGSVIIVMLLFYGRGAAIRG